MHLHDDMWNGVFSRIREAMQHREATHAILYLLTRDSKPHLLPLHEYGTEQTATDLSRQDNIKYIAFVLVSNRDGMRDSEFHPIYPSIEWPHEIVQDIVHRAHEITW
jgi:hypothetical protein